MAESQPTIEENEILTNFLEWCEEHRIKISSKIQITSHSTSHRYGVIALKDIKQNETLVDIPRHITLSPSKSSISKKLKEFVKANTIELEETSGWIPLLLSLMSEIKSTDSLWAPYLSLCPVKDDFNQPMFWSKEEKEEELTGLSILWDVQRDLFNIEKEYQQFVIPFIKSNPDIMSLEVHDLDLYKHMVGFVMSYSFTDAEDDTTLMVPVADIFNHHSNNNANLAFEDSKLKMVSTRPIKKGDEIFNTFGKLGNAQLLHMYGFVEQTQNSYDIIEIPLMSIVDILEAADPEKLPVLQAMLAYMKKMGIADEKEPFVFCSSGLKTGPDMYAVLRILHMELKEFTGLLQDHVKWYQDEYFQYLLEHVQEVTSGTKSKDNDKFIELNDSDDDVVIVKEVKGNQDSKNANEAVENDNGKNESVEIEQKESICVASDDMTLAKCDEGGKRAMKEKSKDISENTEYAMKGIENEIDDNTGKFDNDKRSKMNTEISIVDKDLSKSRKELQVDKEPSKIDHPEKKQSPNSDGQKKIRSRKRKFAQPILDCEDSDDDLIIDEPRLSRKADHSKIRKSKSVKLAAGNKEVSGKVDIHERVPGGLTSPASLDEELPCLKGEGGNHSEDPEDGTDDEDSETYLQLSYDQVNSILPPSWKTTMKSVIINALAAFKEDKDQIDESKMAARQLLAYRVRVGQRRILQLLEMSLSS